MKDRHRRAAGLVVTALVALLAAAAPASAGGTGAIIVRGTQLAAGTCESGGYAMTGALEGCWWIDTFVPKGAEDKAHFRATGEEHFEGCLGSICGTFTTTYSFTAKTDGPWVSSAEIHGRCHHPITGGTGAFAGASGEISFHDVVDVSPPFYPYWGNVRLDGASGQATLGRASTTLAGDATATTC
jgi:hypothetical protein